MYDRKKYKKFAIKQLEKRWLIPVLITISIGFIMFLFKVPELIKDLTSQDYRFLLTRNYNSFREMYVAVNDYSKANPTSNTVDFIRLIVEGILVYAGTCVYLKMSRSPEKIFYSDFIEGLNNWGKAALATLWQTLWTFVWSLLFLIPGIVKWISYSQMKYILMEYKNVSITKAMRISMIITNGHKMDLFVTYLSFLGWMILSTLTLGIGFIFLKPYMEMTLVNAYHALMMEALETGKILAEDLE